MLSRRNFLSNSLCGGITTAIPAKKLVFKEEQQHSRNGHSWKMGIAGPSLPASADKVISIIQQLNLNYFSIKDFQLPYDSSPEYVSELKRKFNLAGITIYAAGVIYIKTTTDIIQAFEYASRIGVDLITISLPKNIIPAMEAMAIKYNIRAAIHNRPEEHLYKNVQEIFDQVYARDGRIGLCLDIGHAIRSGTDPAWAIRQFKDRIFDIHIKDLLDKGPEEHITEIGRGIIDFKALLLALNQTGYSGKCSIEYEKETEDRLPGLAESAGFFRGADKMLS